MFNIFKPSGACMNLFVPIVVLAAALCAPLVHAQDATAVAEAKQAADRWLALLDEGNAGATWEQSASMVQSMVSKAAWMDSMKAARAPLGAVKSRTLSSAEFTRSLPGAPAGEYVVIQYATSFVKAPATVETLIPMRDRDGKWKVSGYFIK
jgi:hypothetical protein